MTREQFIAKVNETGVDLRRFLVSLCCGDSQLADDIAQDAYLKAYLNIDSLKDESKFKGWIFKIAVNNFLSAKRKKAETLPISEAHSISADSQTDDKFKYQKLYMALQQLTPVIRASIVLYYLQQYSIKEICAITRQSESAVKQQLSRGRNILRTILKE